MKYAIIVIGGVVIGAISAILECGWIKDGVFNPVGALVNIVSVIIFVTIVNAIIKE